MDKRKLIGTIIGVTMFAALIVGATFAWLTFTANVTNATYVTKTMNFLVDYTKGNAIVDIPIVTEGAPTTGYSSHLIVKAKKHAGSPDGYLTVHLSTTSNNNLTTGSIINWAVCKGACTTNFGSAVATGVLGTGSGGTEASPKKIDLYKDNEILQDTDVSYYVYFWIDAEKVTNSHLNQQFSGYIHASAEQEET